MVYTSRSHLAACACAPAALLLLAAAGPCSARPMFLPTRGADELRVAVEGELLAAVEGALSSGGPLWAEPQLLLLEEKLRPTFQALPKLPGGGIGAPAARYALHRLFMQRHAWQVRGLVPNGAAWDAESPTAALGDRVPTEVRALFEERLAGSGLALRDLVALAASIEQLVYRDALSRLQALWEALGLSDDAIQRKSQVDAILVKYMATYILGVEAPKLSAKTVKQATEEIWTEYASFNDTIAWVMGVRQDVRPRVQHFTLRDVEAIVERVVERYGRWQASECSGVKDQLVDMEERPGSGRAPLASFYGAALRGESSQFWESTDYLRQLGALDETTGSPQVIIANYVSSPANCLPSLEYYSVCCVDGCESIFGHLERELAAPSATPEDILAAVASLPDGRAPHPSLARRLSEAAELHGGLVPLHGRLFAQWLHLAYPRECPYPHVSGTTSPMAPLDWQQLGQEAGASEEEITQMAAPARASAGARARVDAAEDLSSRVWTMEEELFTASVPGEGRASGTPLYVSFLVGAATTLAITAVRVVATVDVVRSADTGAPVKRVYHI